MSENREYKSDVFSMLMEDKRYALEVYNALNGSDYSDLEQGKDLFSRRRIAIPTPHFVVFYNGAEKRPEYEEMKLSDAFCHPAEHPGIEVLCRVYNINPSQNEKLKARCRVLEGYTYFVERVREYHGREETKANAVELAIKDCLEHGVLTEFFQNRKDEVIKMTHLDFTWERREELIRKEEREEGRLESLRNMLAAGLTDDILRIAGFSPEEIEREKTRK